MRSNSRFSGERSGAPIGRTVLLMIAAVAAVGGVALQILLFQIENRPEPRRLWGDEVMYWRLAEAEVGGEEAAIDPLWPPLYPRFLAAVTRLAGSARLSSLSQDSSASSTGSRLPVEVIQILLFAVVAGLVARAGGALTGSKIAGLVAAALFLLDPQAAAFAHYLWPEILHLALFLAAVWILVERRESVAWAAVLGLLLGLAILTKSLLGPFLPVLLAPLAAAGAWRRRALRVGVALATLLIAVAPTLLANRERFGGWMIADSARFNLWVGLNDRSRKDLVDEIVGAEYDQLRPLPVAERDALLERQTRELIAERGWMRVLRDQLGRQYFRLFDKDSFFTDQLPGGAIHRQGAGYRRAPEALVPLLRGASYAFYGFVLVAAACGAAGIAWRQRRALWPLAAFLAYNLAIFLFLHVKSRYRLQLLPALDLLAGAALARWMEGTPLSSRARWVAAAGAGGALLLAFGGFLFD